MNECGLEFLGLFGEFGEDSVDVGPVETDACGLAGKLNGFEEGGEGAGDAVEVRLDRFLFGLSTGVGTLLLFDDFPVAEDVSGGFGGGGAEDVRVAANHFVVDFADDVGDGKALFFVSDLGVEKDLKK